MVSFVLDKTKVLPHMNILKSIVSSRGFGEHDYVMFNLMENAELQLSVQNQTSFYSFIVPYHLIGAEGITKWAVDFKVFSSIINYNGEDNVKIKVDDNECQFLYNKLRVKSQILDKEIMFEQSHEDIEPKEVSHYMYKVYPYIPYLMLAADSNIFSRDNVVWFDKQTVFCTDGFRMNIYKDNELSFETPICLSVSTANTVSAICEKQGNSDFKCFLNENKIIIESEAYSYYSNLLLYDIPEYEYILEFEREFMLKFSKEELTKNLPYMKLSLDKEQNEKVTFTIPNASNTCILKSNNEVSSCEAAVIGDWKFDSQVQFELQHKHIADCLSNINSSDMLISFSNDVTVPILITSEEEKVKQYVTRLDEG